MGNENKVVPIDDLPTNLRVVPQDDLPTSDVKKNSVNEQVSPQQSATTTGSQEVSAPESSQVVEPSLENGGKVDYQWSNNAPKTELATGGENNSIAPIFTAEVGQKIGKKRIGEYLSDKSRDQLHAHVEASDAQTTAQFLAQSNNFKQYQQKQAELNQAIQNNDGESAARLQSEVEQLKKLPLLISTSPEQTNPNGIIKPFGDDANDKIFTLMPKELKDAKTVGDAAILADKLPKQMDNAKLKYDKAQMDMDEVIDPLRKNANFSVDEKSGIHEYGIGHAFLKGALNVVDKTSQAIQMMSAKDDADLISILKNNQGMQNVAFPEKPSGMVASAVEQGAGLLPYFATGGAGTVGAAITNGLMMGATGYADGMQRGFDEAIAQGQTEEQALQTAKTMGGAGGAMGAGIGSIGLMATGMIGESVGAKVLGREVVDATKLNLPDYLKYTLPKNAVSNLPFPIQTYLDNKIAQSQGLNRGSMNGVGESLATAIMIGGVVDGLHYGGAKLTPKVKSIYETGIAKFGLAPTLTEINKQVQSGNLTQAEADNITAPIISKAEALKVMPTDLTPHEEQKVMPVFERWVDVKKKIESAKKEKNDVLLPELEAEEHSIRREAQEKLGTALSPKEMQAHEDLKIRAKEKDAEGNITPLTPLEKADLKHYDARLEARDAKVEAEKQRIVEEKKQEDAETPEPTPIGKPDAETPKEDVVEGGKEEPVLPKVEETPTEQDQLKEQDELDALLSGGAEKNRKKGSFTKDGVTYTRNEKQNTPTGKEGVVKFTENTNVPFEYTLVEAGDLQPSHIGGKRNPKFFLTEAQPKNRTDKSSQEASDRIASEPDMKRLGENENAYFGSPVVNERGEVIQGNNRSEGLRKHYNQGKEDYKAQLAADAEKFGLTKEQVEGMKEPVLVRKIKVDDRTAIELGNNDVKDLETGGKRRIDPITTARRIPQGAKGEITDALFKENPDKTINAAVRDNFKKLIELVKPYLSNTQLETIVTKEGEPRPEGLRDLETLVQHFLYDGGDNNLPDLFEGMSGAAKGGLTKAIPKIFGVPKSKSILYEIQHGITAVNDFANSKMESFDAWKQTIDMFKGGKTPNDLYTPLELAIGKKLAEGTDKQIKDTFAEYAEAANGKLGDLLGGAEAPLSKEEAIEKVFKIKYDGQGIKDEGNGSGSKPNGQEVGKEVAKDEPATDTKPTGKVNLFDKISESKRSKKTQKGKLEAAEEAVKEFGEQGKRAIEIETNFKSLVERLKSINDESGEPILKVKC